MKKIILKIIVAVSLLAPTACSGKVSANRKPSLAPVKYEHLNGWNGGDHHKAMLAFRKSCTKYTGKPQDMRLHTSGIGGTYGIWQTLCAKAAGSKDPKSFFETNFIPYKVTHHGKDTGLFTGYFESELNGSRTKKAPYIYPVYKTPPGLSAQIPYYSRKEIDAGALRDKGLEILWVDDPVKLFFMHIQGSGRIKLKDGKIIRLAYDSRNGHKYHAIGKYLVDKGYMDKQNVSKTSIEKWLLENPDKMQETLEKNPTYIFFREIKGDGPLGAQGVPLTAMASLAIDNDFIPYGVPIWLDTYLNGDNDKDSRKIFRKLLIAQDTGKAITGAIRGDIFFGHDQYAEKMAGYQHSEGKYFLLLPRGGE